MCLRKNTAIIQLKAISYRVPLPITQVVKSYDGFFDSLCPRCHEILPYEYIRYCPLCGQRLCWLFLDEAAELDSAYMLRSRRNCFSYNNYWYVSWFVNKHIEDCYIISK